uniref:Protein SZT2 n=1 Tax=Ditylenchus dipsaci TaxID=166011 RepID=A0A915DUR7_9BILA
MQTELNRTNHETVPKTCREAREISLFMERDVRISRNVRAAWYFDHLEKSIGLNKTRNSGHAPETSGQHIQSDYEGISVVGITAKDGEPVQEDEKFVVTTSTTITYFSKLYRFIFVLDFSPSSFVSDENDEAVLYIKLIDSVIKCIQNLVKKFKFPGGQEIFQPQLLASFCAFTPFLCFSEDSVLLQGVLLNEETMQDILDFLSVKIRNYLNKLCMFTQPHMKEWNTKRRKCRKFNDDVLTSLFQQNSSFCEDISVSQPKPFCSTTSSSTVGTQSLTDKGFIQPDWALVFMLRMGLMGVQMLPENTQSNVVILTDGVCGIPDLQALQNILSQLRSNTIAVSFIQLRQSSLSGPVLGHVGFPQLFRFLSAATFGKFLTEDELEQRSKDPLEFNMYHKNLLCWSFHRALIKNSILPENVPMFPSYTRNRKLSRSYEANLYQLLYVRLREGYALKQVDIQKRSQDVEIITVKLCLAWKPNVNFDYVITSPWSTHNKNTNKKYKIHVDVFVDGSDIFGEKDVDSIKSAIFNVNQDDCLLMHLHLFNCDTHYCSLPKEFDKKTALFEYRKSSQKPVLLEAYENLKNSKFVTFWQPLCALDDALWQKLFHTHTLRLCLTHDLPLPDKIFTPSLNKGRFPQITSEVAFHELHELLHNHSAFTLVKDHLYISWEEKENPSYFYLIKASLEMPFVILRLGFLGGVSGITRNKVFDSLKSLLERLNIKREVQFVNSMEAISTSFSDYNFSFHQSFTKTLDSKLLTVLRKPMEKILARYRSIPKLLEQIIRLESSANLRDKREMILHNAIAKYMCTKRQIWHLRGVFLKSSFLSNNATRSHIASAEVACIEFILQTLMRRRLNQGFSIAYGRSGIVNLTRQREDGSVLPRVEQCVIFSPLVDNNISSDWRSLMHLRQHSVKYGYDPAASNLSTLKSNNNGVYPEKENSTVSVPWPQLVVEIWSEPQGNTNQQDIKGDSTKTQLLAENDSLIRTLFTFEQWIKACNSKIWIEKPFVLPNEGLEAVKMSPAVDCFLDTFSFKTMLKNATEKELMLLPALGYSNYDPHSNTRLSILLKSLKRELVETCDACVEVTDEEFLLDIISFLQIHFKSDTSTTQQQQQEEVQVTLDTPSNNLTTDQNMTNSLNAIYSSSTDFKTAISSPASPNFQASSAFSPIQQQRPETNNICSASTWLIQDNDCEQQPHHNITIQELLGERRSTSVPLLNKLPAQKDGKEMVETTATRKTLGVADVHGHPEFRSAFNMHTTADQPMANTNGNTAEIGQEIKKKFSSTAFSNDELCSPTKGSGRTMPAPTKKYSAPPSSLNRGPVGSSHQLSEVADKVKQQSVHRFAGVGVRIYSKRLNDYRMVMFVVPNDARSVNALMPAEQVHCFPVLAYHCDRAKMAQWLAESSNILAEEFRREVVVESFCHKSEASTLAQLSRQVSRRAKDCSKSEESMESFYVLGSEPRTEQREQQQPIHTAFHLSKYCEEFFEEYVFTRSFIATIYVCLGQEIFVPSPVLLEAVDYRCEHLNIEIGSINEILNDTCVHMKKRTKRVPKKPRHQRLFSSSSSSSSSSSTLNGPVCEHGPSVQKGQVDGEIISFRSDEDQLFEKEDSDNGDLSTSTNDETACEDELNDFRSSFDNLLKSHHFVKVPGLKDESYFFYWPQTHSTDMNAQLASFDDFSEDLPTVLSPCNNSTVVFGQKSNFSRNNSARNTIASYSTRPVNLSRGTRKTSASTISKRRSTNTSDIFSNANDDEIRSILTRQSSSESWEVECCTDNDDSESEKSSLAEEFLLGTDKWPLFIQFSVAVHVNDQMETFSIEFIPNCLKDILEKCSPAMLPKQEDAVFISIDMYVLSWPLRAYENDGETDSLDGEFNTSGGDKHKRIGQPQTIGRYSIMNIDEDHEDIFEQPVERLREIPVQEHRTLRRLQRNIQRMLKIEHILIMSRDFDKKKETVHLRTFVHKNCSKITNRFEESFGSSQKKKALGANRWPIRDVDYCSLRRFPTLSSLDSSSAKSSNCFSQNRDQKHNQSPRCFKRDYKEPLIFYCCGVDDAEAFAKIRHESILSSSRQSSQKRPFSHLKDEFSLQSRSKTAKKTPRQASNISFQDDDFIVDIEGSQQHLCSKRDTKKHSFERVSETSSEDTNNETTSNVTELTMPLNDCDFDPMGNL